MASVSLVQGHLEEIYQVEVSRGLISSVRGEVIDEVKTWRNRQLDEVYAVYLDAIQFKVRDEGARQERSGLSSDRTATRESMFTTKAPRKFRATSLRPPKNLQTAPSSTMI